MSEVDSVSTQQWFWTDELARLLVGRGYALVPPLDGWLATPFAIRRQGEPLAVALELLAKREESTAAA